MPQELFLQKQFINFLHNHVVNLAELNIQMKYCAKGNRNWQSTHKI